MLSLSHPLRSCSSRLLLHSSSSLFSLRPSSLFFLPSPISPNPNRAMSSSNPRNAFDLLMSKGRGGAKKNPPPQTPKKRKTLTPPPKHEPTADPPPTAAAYPTPNASPPTAAASPTPNASPPTAAASPTPNASPPTAAASPPTAAASPTPNASPPTAAAESEPEMKKEDSAVVAPPPMKKPRAAASVVKERTAQLASRIELLKRKALDFDPNALAVWGKGDRVPFIFLALTFDLISKEKRRIVITDIVCNMLRTVIHTTPEDLLPTVYLSASRIAPPNEGVELGMGESTIIKALAEACGRSDEYVKKQLNAEGDLGIVAQKSRSSQSMMFTPEPLTVTKVFNTFRALAKESGKDSQEKKKKHFKSLLVAATDVEPQYLTRFLQSKMRIGLAEQTLLAALGQAAFYSEQHSAPPPNVQATVEEAARIVKQVYSLLPVYDKIIANLLSDGVWNLPKTCTFTLGIPVGPMLAKRSDGVSEIVQKFQGTEYTCEYKYDGERAQIHYMEDGSVEIYSRNAERSTEKFPDVAVAVSRLKKSSIKSFVLDCELVAYDPAEKKIQSFQKLSTRPRKNVSISDITVHVAIFAFDLLFHNGQPLIQEQLKVRREYLYNSFEEEAGVFQFATSITSNDIDEIQKFLDAAVNSSSEGLIIKTLSKDATYEPSKRSLNWLKLKKDYIDSLGDSLDLVPIAAFHGRGKRTGVYGAFLLACYDDKNEEFQSICKIGTGFSEAQLEERSVSLREKVIPKPKTYYSYAETSNANTPDVWFEPSQVWEVKAADLTVSPVYRAAVGIVDDHKGISLRFPRLVRVREDKKPEDATSSDEVAEMYNAQANKTSNHKDEQEDE